MQSQTPPTPNISNFQTNHLEKLWFKPLVLNFAFQPQNLIQIIRFFFYKKMIMESKFFLQFISNLYIIIFLRKLTTTNPTLILHICLNWDLNPCIKYVYFIITNNDCIKICIYPFTYSNAKLSISNRKNQRDFGLADP